MPKPKSSPAAESNTAPQATEAAERVAEEEGVALAEVTPSGADDKIIVSDVEQVARKKEASEESLVAVEMNRDAFVGAGDRVEYKGVEYVYSPDVTPPNVTERFFDEELAPLKNFEGVPYFRKGQEVISNG